MASQIMRPLTKKENNLFLYFLLGYKQGLASVPANKIHSNKQISFEKHIPIAYKESVSIFKRRKIRYEEFKKGFIDGYFKSMSCEKPICQMDPFRNKDIYKYLESLWIHEKVYGATETSRK